jgi:hypothetical protein
MQPRESYHCIAKSLLLFDDYASTRARCVDASKIHSSMMLSSQKPKVDIPAFIKSTSSETMMGSEGSTRKANTVTKGKCTTNLCYNGSY